MSPVRKVSRKLKMRVDRLVNRSSECLIFTGTNTQNIFQSIEEVEPNVLVIDSIQTLHTNSIDVLLGAFLKLEKPQPN